MNSPEAVARRGVLLGLSAAMMASGAPAQPMRGLVAAQRLGNVMLAVSDLARSMAFYEKLFGPPVRQGDAAVFRVGTGPDFFALVGAANRAKPAFLSYGLAVANFDAESVAKLLAGAGVTAEVRQRGGTPELFLRDPNGIKIQLQHPAYGYGSGPRGDVLPPPARAAASPAFRLRTLNHVTLSVTDGSKSLEFYQSIFGLAVRSRQGNTVVVQIGTSDASIAFNAAAHSPGGSAGINHACFTVADFDPAKAMGVLMDNGLEPIEFGNPALIKPLTCRVRLRQRANNGGGPTSPLGTAELYFTDPDNLSIQLQDVSYCGGSGWRGQICP